MNKKKAIEILQKQKEKIKDEPDLQDYTWTIQTRTCIKDFFGEDSNEYFFIKNFSFGNHVYSEETGNYVKPKIELPIAEISRFLDKCVETINYKGLYRPRKSYVFNEQWTKDHPILFEIIKWAIPIIGAFLIGYFSP